MNHYCALPRPPGRHGYGPAVDDCAEDADGTLHVGNGEYGSQVNYCPVCGYRATVQIIVEVPREKHS